MPTPPPVVGGVSIKVSVDEAGDGGAGFVDEQVLDLGVVKGPTVEEDLARVMTGGDKVDIQSSRGGGEVYKRVRGRGRETDGGVL